MRSKIKLWLKTLKGQPLYICAQ